MELVDTVQENSKAEISSVFFFLVSEKPQTVKLSERSNT